MNRKEEFVRRLLRWFRENGRNYPWRQSTDPYRVLMAEIMLQRTKADQVLPVYLSFIERFPTPRALAMAPPDEIRKVFASLGLMWRAERVMKLGAVLMSDHRGRVPDTREELLSLPGVGEYAADAVLCFAYGRNVAVVDANVCRVIGRVFGLKPRGEARRDPRYRSIVQGMIPGERARESNWALIDLASLICPPRNPKHMECPLLKICSRVHEAGGADT